MDFEQQRVALARYAAVFTYRNGPVGNPINSLRFDIWKPDGYVINLEFRDKSGQTLQTDGMLQSVDTRVYHFREKIRDDWRLVVYLAAPAAIQRHPFCAENVPVRVRDL